MPSTMALLQALLDMLPPPGLGWPVAVALLGVLLCATGVALVFQLGPRGARLPGRPGRPRRAHDPQRARDTLTGLATREAFESALEDAVYRAEHHEGPPVSVLYVGLDDLRSINDGWGLSAGDAMLVEVAERLESLQRPDPSATEAAVQAVARVGGDEFVLLVHGDEAAAIGMAMSVCAAVARPVAPAPSAAPSRVPSPAPASSPSSSSSSASASSPPPGTTPALSVTVSVGVACYPDHGAWSRLLPHAAAAMRYVKQGGGNSHAVFAAAMAVDLREQALLLQDLRRAVDLGQLRLLYQPKIDATSLQITAAEALLRWEHPVRGVVPPAVFIPLAERHGLIGTIGEWVVAEACRQAAAWRENGLRMRIAINLSGHQLRHDRFVAHLIAQTQHHRIPPTRLTCEITESVAMEDTAQTRAAFERLRRAGFHVSIDDFGTGYSSLAVLRRLPAAELKVDRSFVVDLEVSESARSIVEAVVSVARTLGLRVVAEGVETEAQRDILVRLGCDELQGFLFARPMSAAALALWAEGGGPDSAPGGRTSTPGAMRAAAASLAPAGDFRPSLFQATAPLTLAQSPPRSDSAEPANAG
jgi:diguanylate cyclase